MSHAKVCAAALPSEAGQIAITHGFMSLYVMIGRRLPPYPLYMPQNAVNEPNLASECRSLR